MGLSRKLGASGPRTVEAEGTAVPYKWSTQTYTIAELLAKFKLPCVVQCATGKIQAEVMRSKLYKILQGKLQCVKRKGNTS